MADVFTVLAQDHQEVRSMLAALEKGPTRATGANQDQLALRKKMTEQLIIEESKHVLADLDKLGSGDAEFEKLLAKFIMDAREHIEFEESRVWPLLRAALSAETSAELGAKITEGKKR